MRFRADLKSLKLLILLNLSWCALIFDGRKFLFDKILNMLQYSSVLIDISILVGIFYLLEK